MYSKYFHDKIKVAPLYFSTLNTTEILPHCVRLDDNKKTHKKTHN